MSGFRFALERVLSWRETKLSLEEADLERLRLEKDAVERAIADLARRNERENAALGLRQSLTGDDVRGLAASREWIALEEKRLRAKIADCMQAMEKRAAAVVEARRDVRLVQKLKERRRASWRKEVNRQADELAGESAINGWRRENSRSAESENQL
jgi:flagellar biosynthesis chaperone FliJ